MGVCGPRLLPEVADAREGQVGDGKTTCFISILPLRYNLVGPAIGQGPSPTILMFKNKKIWLSVFCSLVIAAFILSPSQKNRFRVKSKILAERRTILIHQPQDYEDSGESYPVLYCLDAFHRISTFGPSFYTTAEQVEKMTLEGIPPMIIVGIMNTNRDRDMTPAKTDFHPQGGGAQDFLAFFIKELIPYVDQKYRTSNMRILYGRSDSGLFALYALLESPDTFSAVISSSPTVGLSPMLLKTKTVEMFQIHPHLNNRLYIIYGNNDIPLAKDFIPEFIHSVLSYKNPEFNFEAKVISDGGHIPESSLFHGLRFIFNN